MAVSLSRPADPRAEATPRPAACIFTIDVEDWFHFLEIPSVPDISEWDALPSRVEANTRRLFDLLEPASVRATCFFLGYVARRFPELVKDARARGHEVASHGFAHKLVYESGPDEFLEDIRRAKGILEDLTGAPVLGYRSPGFSATGATPWFFDKLIEAGYRYDSSIFPARRGHGGMRGERIAPWVVERDGGRIAELPITVASLLGARLCFSGGGYLRLFPYPLVRALARRVLREGRPVVFYTHPREIDPGHPRLPMKLTRRIKSYINLESTEPKIRGIIVEFPILTVQDYLKANSFLGGDT